MLGLLSKWKIEKGEPPRTRTRIGVWAWGGKKEEVKENRRKSSWDAIERTKCLNEAAEECAGGMDCRKKSKIKMKKNEEYIAEKLLKRISI